MGKLFKLNFEKATIFVLILILLISTANIYTQFFGLASPDKRVNTMEPPNIVKLSFPIMLLKADDLFKQGNYAKAQEEYLMLTKLTAISNQQKATAHFKLGLCNYMMGLYDMASDSFIQSANFNTSDAIAYNNAGVCAYLANNETMAESYQKKAIAILPAVEFYYNLGRVYEGIKKYEDAAKYYMAIIKEEENLTREDRIDPIKVNLKVIKLFPEKETRDKLSEELFIALKLKDTREVLVLSDAEMDVKENFDIKLLNVDGLGKLYCKYDREKMDPYHLIDSLSWVVKKDNNTVYTGNKDDFTIKVQEQDDYEVALNIKYNGNKEKASNKIIRRWQIVDKLAQSKPLPFKPTGEVCKYYVYAAYEQVFEKEFKLRSKGYTDRFNVVWGKNNIETSIMEKDIIDAASSLYIKNTSDNGAGIWADLSTLLDDKQLKGKTVSIRLYARKITEGAKLDVKIRVKAEKIFNKGGVFPLGYKWQQISNEIYIPENANGLTLSMNIEPGEEIKVDGFIISIIR